VLHRHHFLLDAHMVWLLAFLDILAECGYLR
jgi:hypothetical protein